MTEVMPSFVSPDTSTAYILGNGPSLRDIDLTTLKGATFGLNAAYRYWREIDWSPTHYACLDLVVGLSHKDEIAKLIDKGDIGLFLLRDNLIAALGPVAHSQKIVNFDSLQSREPLFQNASITTGSGAAIWAATLGYKPLVLLGVDGRYKQIVEGARKRDGIELEIVEPGDNPNYFYNAYQQPGDRYNLPNPRPDLHIIAWREAGQNLRTAGIDIYNTAPHSAVQCFPFIDIDVFMAGGAEPIPPNEPLEPAPKMDTTNSAPLGAKNNQFSHVAQLFLPAFLATVGLAALLWVWLGSTKPTNAVLVLAIFSGLSWIAFVLGGLYTRSRIISHLHSADAKITQLSARVTDLERNISHK